MGTEKLIAFGGASVYSSPDGETWKTEITTPWAETENAQIFAMASSSSQVVAVGAVGEIVGLYMEYPNDSARVARSTPANLSAWSDLEPLPINGKATAVAYSPELGIFVAGGAPEWNWPAPEPQADVAISIDGGITWETHALPGNTTAITDIQWIDAFQMFVLTGYTLDDDVLGGGVLTSPDGVTWSDPIGLYANVYPGDPTDGLIWGGFRGVSYAPELGRAVVWGNYYYHSTDGAIWTQFDLGSANLPPYLSGYAWSPDLGYFLGAGFPGAITS